MAPNAPSTGAHTSHKARRSMPRIIPAVPLALSRAPPAVPRPMTPDETATDKDTATQRGPETQASAPAEVGEQPSAPIKAPLTPESKASGFNNEDAEQKTPASSLAGTGDEPRESVDTREPVANDVGTAADDASSQSHAEPQGATLENVGAVAPPPTELPPPFYPSQKLPADFTSAEPPFQLPSTHVHGHQPSLEGIVFGAVQDSPAVPSTPQEVEPEFRATRQPLHPTAPGFAPSQFAAPFYPGHSHHPSDASAVWLPPYTLVTPDSVHAHGQDHGSTQFSAAAAHQAAYPDHFTQDRVPSFPNGAIQTPTSHSQSPIKSHVSETKPPSDFGEDTRLQSYQNGSIMPVVDHKMDPSPIELAAYLSAHFGNPEFADFILQVRSDGPTLLNMPVHGIVVARSRPIYSAIQRSAPPAFRSKDARALLDIFTSDQFVTSEALSEAVKILYGGPLLSYESFLYGMRPFNFDGEQGPTFNEARKRAAQAISYAAAGQVLQLPSMQARGVDVTKALLRWDTIDLVLHAALEGGLGQLPDSSNGVAPSHSYQAMHNSYGASLLHEVLDFVAYNFPADYELHPVAPELARNPRLPSITEHRAPTHNPRLSKIRFGEIPPEEPSYIVRMLSTILLSLPQQLLQQLFNHPALANRIGWTRVAEVMRSVIDEREGRRDKALKNLSHMSQSSGPQKPLLENLYWEERLEQSRDLPSGYKLTETRITV